MSEIRKFAVRNIRVCTKDCLCLYVCPTGATDTENSIIDVTTCTGCGACVESCPSGAISLVPEQMPPQQKKKEAVIAALGKLIKSKATQEHIASELPGKMATAIERSCRIMLEDLLRESGYMLPQSGAVHAIMESLLDAPHREGFPHEAVETLLQVLAVNDQINT